MNQRKLFIMTVQSFTINIYYWKTYCRIKINDILSGMYKQ